ncbi:armadillo-type protein [Trametes polyzona]|nr:armadillo-type protein [Trametes polyzona]
MRMIEDITTIKYPEGIRGPKEELNVNAIHGRFRYDRDFLLQFMPVCKQRPAALPPLDSIGLIPVIRTPHIIDCVPGDPVPVAKPPPVPRPLPESTPRPAFIHSNPRPTPNVLNGSGLTWHWKPLKRPREPRATANTSSSGSHAASDSSPVDSALLQQTADSEGSRPPRLVATSLIRDGPLPESDSPEVVERRVRALLNKLTLANFNSISNQIIAWAKKSEQERDGRTLNQVIRLVLAHATDEGPWLEMYALLCRRMMEQISPQLCDEDVTDAEGRPIVGGKLVRQYLVYRCPEEFERRWIRKEVAAAAQGRTGKGTATEAAVNDPEARLTQSDELLVAKEAKRRFLAFIAFIGELFKLQMLTERIMHNCVRVLLGGDYSRVPDEKEVETLHTLFANVGRILDTPKARAHVDKYFSRIRELVQNPNVKPRARFRLQDIVELRERKWESRPPARPLSPCPPQCLRRPIQGV